MSKRAKGKEIAQRLVKQLRRDLKGIGWGAKKRALEAAGLSRAYLENVKPERIPLGNYFELLEGVGIDPVAHTRRALTDNEPIQDFIADARNIAAKSGVPPIVRLARKRGAAGMPEDAAGEDLEAIDGIRYRNPAAAARRVERLMSCLSGRRTVQKALVTWGAAQRGLGRLDLAAVALGECGQSLDWCKRPRESSILISHFYSCLRSRHQYEWALQLNFLGFGELIRSGELERLSTAAVDCGQVLAKLRRFGQCEMWLRHSECFPSNSNVTAARLQTASWIAREQGNFKIANCHVRSLLSLHSSNRLIRGTSLTSWADLERDRGKYTAAIELYERAVSVLEPWPFMAMQAAVHQVAANLQAGNPRHAAWCARGLEEYSGAFSFQSHRAPLLLDDLIAAGHQGEVALPLVEDLIEELHC